jgi:hypothetical protein
MLVIRHDQVKALGEYRERAFLARAVRHLHEAFPARCQALGDEEVKRSVGLAMRKARGYGLPREVDILRYLNLMYVFGFDFDTLPWANEVLADMEISAEPKIEELMENAFEAEASMLRRPLDG